MKTELIASPSTVITMIARTVSKGAMDTNKQPKINIASIKKTNLKYAILLPLQ
jgi:hypothetical protein